MNIAELLRPENVLVDMDASSKQQLLQQLSQRAAEVTGLDPAAVLNGLSHRETLGSTGIGQGIAIPHSAPAGLAAPFALLARTAKPVEFDAIDDQPVDLIFLLLSPADRASHLKALSVVSRQLRAAGVTEKLRRARTAGEMYAAMAAE
ncbi:MAG: PTS sugar transporter subunit IIA [Devosia sp.]|nr:PTS sugar transporter subunit IIA [Devosia sp.]